MLATEGLGVPLTAQIASASTSEYKLALPTLDAIQVPIRPNHPRKRAEWVCADKGYDARWLRDEIKKRGMNPCIPHRRKRGSDKEPVMSKKQQSVYQTRWVVERTFAWLGNFRRLAVRWDYHALMYDAFLTVGCILICLRMVLK